MDSGIAKDRRVVDAGAVRRGRMGRVGGPFDDALVRGDADHTPITRATANVR